jgi:hypothetical protein
VGDWFAAAQSQYDHAVPSYLEDESDYCEVCGDLVEDHCVDCKDCDCSCDEEEED